MSDIHGNNPKPPKKTAPTLRLARPPQTIPGRKDLDRLPADMVVTIDGKARTGKNTVGELLAGALGGVLVDSGRFYRSLTQAAVLAGVDLDDPLAVESFCAGARLDAVFRPNAKGVFEALVTVDSGLFAEATLVAVGSITSKVAKVPLVRALVNATIRRLHTGGRMVVLGRDMGAKVFPNTPYQFAFRAAGHIRELRDSGNPQSKAVAQRDQDDADQTVFPSRAEEVDTGEKTPTELLGLLFDEIALRTPE